MLRNFVCSLLFFATIGIACSASADVFTTQRATATGTAVTAGGFLPQGAQVVGGNVTNVNAIGISSGISFNNNISSAQQSLAGWTIRTVTSGSLGTFAREPGGTPLGTFTTGGANPEFFNLVGVFVGQANVSVDAMTGAATALFTQGQLALFAVPLGNYDEADPTTWGVGVDGDLNGRPNNAIAIFDLAPQTRVTSDASSGIGDPDGFPVANTIAAIMNTVSLNTLDINDSQGRLVFNDFQDPFLPIPAPVIPPGEQAVNEGIYLTLDQNLYTDLFGLSALNEINRIAGIFGLGNLGGANTGFATTGFNPLIATDFNQQIGGLVLGSGDLAQSTGVDAHPVILSRANQEVPEPASILLWGALTLAGGVYGARRRMKANA